MTALADIASIASPSGSRRIFTSATTTAAADLTLLSCVSMTPPFAPYPYRTHVRTGRVPGASDSSG